MHSMIVLFKLSKHMKYSYLVLGYIYARTHVYIDIFMLDQSCLTHCL